ncbi:hypothetical protein EXIGLDRAFT_779309 [Exidia glandulosa HHB12029]|uniref:Uncharacterized protein n=1 Tax=Exidia glandulosa HHB12029 TaxID=1314781 RepID=A0A165C4P7_EXIGL|nr:hypothetical protein EXIGLDRAFT_779309 [Exidia glandulosa HHB12029]
MFAITRLQRLDPGICSDAKNDAMSVPVGASLFFLAPACADDDGLVFQCLTPSASDVNQKPAPTASEPSPENGAHPGVTDAPSTSAPVMTDGQGVGTAPVDASPDAAVQTVPSEPGTVTAPRVDTGMSIPISISESDDGTAKGDVGPGYVSTGSKDAKGGKPPPKPVKGSVKRRFGLPFGRTDEE